MSRAFSFLIVSLLLGFWFVLVPFAHAQTNAADDASSSANPANTPADTTPAPPPTRMNDDQRDGPVVMPPSATPATPPASTTPDTTPAPPADAASPQVTPSTAPTNTPPKQEDIYDIRPPFFFIRSWFWWWIALAAIVAIALLVALVMWLKPNRLLSAKSAYELTLEKLEKARALLKEENPMPYAVLVSETIRNYLGQRFQTPSTRRTTEEFLRVMEADRGTPLADYRDLLRNFLQSCDMVKFARYQPTLAELEEVHQRAYNFVTATKPAPETGARNGRHP